jgi:hypothetical protein
MRGVTESNDRVATPAMIDSGTIFAVSNFCTYCRRRVEKTRDDNGIVVYVHSVTGSPYCSEESGS